MSSPGRFEIFLHRARRHWMAWTIAEHAGIGLLLGCGCVLLLLPILLYRGAPGQSITLFFPTLGAAAGAVVGYRRRPALREVAQLADARFDTADLLATALALRGTGEPWHLNILTVADACTAGLSPALLTPHRLNGRAWSAIALSLVAALALGLLSITNSADSAKASVVPAKSDDAWRGIEQIEERDQQSLMRASSAAPEARAESTPDSQSMQYADTPSGDQHSAGESEGESSQRQAQAATGAGSARTRLSQATTANDHVNSIATGSSAAGAVSHGGDGSEVQSHAADGTTTGQVGDGQHPVAAPWTGSSWPAAQTAAGDAIRAGRVPDAYRDLLRDYFQN